MRHKIDCLLFVIYGADIVSIEVKILISIQTLQTSASAGHTKSTSRSESGSESQRSPK